MTRARDMSTLAHTPIPWHIGPHYTTDVESSEGRVCECRPMSSPRGVANAALIVRAVNSHAELLAALQDMTARFARCALHCGSSQESVDEATAAARAVVAKATGVEASDG